MTDCPCFISVCLLTREVSLWTNPGWGLGELTLPEATLIKLDVPGCRKSFPIPHHSLMMLCPCALQLHSGTRTPKGLALSRLNSGQSAPPHLAAGFTAWTGKMDHCRQSHYLLRSPNRNLLRFAKYSARYRRGNLSPFTMRLCCTKAIKGNPSRTPLNTDLGLTGFKQIQVSLSSAVLCHLHISSSANFREAASGICYVHKARSPCRPMKFLSEELKSTAIKFYNSRKQS